MEAVTQLPETVRDELGCVFRVSSRRVCEVYGLWMDPSEDSKLFLVCEVFGRRVLCGWNAKEEVNVFAMMGMEMCEAVMELHSRGIVCGCLGVDCFGLDEYGHSLLDLNGVLLAARRIRERIKTVGDETLAFVSPEVFTSLVDNANATNCGYQSDVWSLACVLIMVMLDETPLAAELFDGFVNLISKGFDEYEVWREKLISKLEVHLGSTELHSLLQILSSCLNYDMKSRPSVNELWRCIRFMFVKNQADDMAVPEVLLAEERPPCCLILGDLCSPRNEGVNVSSRQQNGSPLDSTSDASLVGSSGNCSQQEEVDGDLIKGLQRGGLKSVTLYGHQDCITRLAVGGGFLFSSSFDKTVHVWSLQDFSLVQSLKGHEHKVMAMTVLDVGEPLCISGDSGSNILVWRVDKSLGSEPLKKWSEHNDWRYSGVHSLAISGTEYLYSGSGDKSIKAWSLKDYSLSCTMTGHRSTVSSLAVADGILYSGSWDGTIRLWLISDHSPLSILGDDTPGSSPPVLALSVDHHLLASSYENGLLKIWRNEVPVRTMQLQNGAIFALHVDKKWLFTGGWDKIVSIQELLENELQVDIRPVASVTCDALISSLLYHNGKLFIGLSNKEIKVYGCGY